MNMSFDTSGPVLLFARVAAMLVACVTQASARRDAPAGETPAQIRNEIRSLLSD